MTKAPNPTARYDLIDLRVFIAVAEEGNVSRGAARCHLAPSTASLRLKGLEAAIGVRLLQRQARGVSLLPAGRVLLDHARRCVAQLEQMHADLLPFAQGLTSHLTLFANNNAISTHLPDDLSRYFATHPSVRITMKERLSADIVAEWRSRHWRGRDGGDGGAAPRAGLLALSHRPTGPASAARQRAGKTAHRRFRRLLATAVYQFAARGRPAHLPNE
jgi:hypothetical protein